MRGTVVPIPFLGMNNQLLNDQSVDGLCDSIINLKPKGTLERPYWAPFEKINRLKNNTGTDFTYEFGMSSITDAFWQVRNFVGEYSLNPTGSLSRLLILCQNGSRKCIDIIDPTTWAVIKTQALPSDGVYSWSCTRLNEVTIISINKDKKPFSLYYLIDDAFIPAGWPEIPSITFSTAAEVIPTIDVEAGITKGVMREATDQWFLTTWAFRLFDGGHVKHNAPILVKVASGNSKEALKPVFTLNGYSLIENLLIEQPFWKGLIAGISVCVTIPRNEEKAALADGAFFEVGYWSHIDILPVAQWPTAADPNIITVDLKSDNWPTGRKLGIDNFTHHKYSARVVDTYNKRLLLGGSSVNFALPKIITNATQNLVAAGIYSDYLNFDSGFGGVAYEYYLSDGTASNGNSEWDYEVAFINARSVLTPKTGREFKAVTIVDTVVGDEGTNLPHGDNLPFAGYDASLTMMPGKLLLDIESRESTFPESDLPGRIARMRIKLEIGPIGGETDQTIFFWVQPELTSTTFVGFSGVEMQADDITVGTHIYSRIIIKTDSGTYYRVLIGDIQDGVNTVSLPQTIWYPDRRATTYELIVKNGSVYELALSKQMVQHPESNYSYLILSTAEQTYLIGESIVAATEPDLAVNLLNQYVPNRIQASISGNGFIFDPAATYRVGNRENETILGFGVNLNPTSEGQAGQYPVYVFTEKGVSALEQTGDPNIAFGRITPVSNFNGINNPYAITNAGSLIIACDNKYIYALAGLESTRIDDQIANDPDYKDYLKQIRIGFHRASDYEELIFSNPFFDYSLCYNLKYKVWYKATERFKFFFNDYPELLGLTTDNVLKDFSSKNELSPVAWSLISRVIQYQQPYVFKRLFPSIVRMALKQPLQENAESYLPLRVTLMGYRDDQNMIYTLYDQSIKTNNLYDPRIYNQNGSMYAYRVILSGTNYHRQAQIQGLDTDVEFRYETTRRRFNGSSQYLFTMGQLGISIVNYPSGDFKNYYVHPDIITTELFTLPASIHGLNREPDVTLRDADGYTFEAPVRVNKDTFDITILVNPATPYRVLLT
jgi:hypothetical protein